jgi:muramoyltetrapeptide carboxypeptidase LdcA involved in peptidoglycan recycling
MRRTTIGGDESIRTVPYLDLNLIREYPKIASRRAK